MRQTPKATEQNLAERWCRRAARRDDSPIARRLYRKQVVNGVYRLDKGALRDDFFHFLQALGVVDLMERIEGTAIQGEIVPVVQYLLRYGLKTMFGIERMHTLPTLVFSDEALMRLVGFYTQQVRHGVCQQSAAERQRPRTEGPMCLDALANYMVKLHLRDLEAWFNGPMQALAKVAIFGSEITGMIDAKDLETTAAYDGCGLVTRKRKSTDKHGLVREIEVTVYCWKPSVLIEAITRVPLALKVAPI
jgi:hypothetical protein